MKEIMFHQKGAKSLKDSLSAHTAQLRRGQTEVVH